MSILSEFKKIKRYVKESSGYKLISQWTSSQTVEMDDGTTLQHKMKSVDDSLALKAPIESPNLTGTPKAPTASAGTNTTQIANTSFVQSAVSNHNTASSAHSDIRDLISGLTPTDIGALAVDGTATKAINDSDGNAINTTYLKKSGGTVTGETTFSSKVKTNQLIIGTTPISEVGGIWITT